MCEISCKSILLEMKQRDSWLLVMSHDFMGILNWSVSFLNQSSVVRLLLSGNVPLCVPLNQPLGHTGHIWEIYHA